MRQQLLTHLKLSILSGDLKSGEKLPSTREFARWLKIHPNTVSAAYRQLQTEGWVEFRRGSGVFVRSLRRAQAVPQSVALDQLIHQFFAAAREHGITLAELRERLRQWFDLQPPDHFLLIEPDEELRAILAAELRQALAFRVEAAGLERCKTPEALTGALPVALASSLGVVRAALPERTECIALQVQSVPRSLAAWLPIPRDALIVVASRWPTFLTLARTMLLAAGVDAEAVETRDARKPGWRAGLESVTAVVCDVVTASQIHAKCRVISFRLIADSSLEELQRHVTFITGPGVQP
ncbi:MAG: GntR family transcriptional regulator [Acidobacteriia bacterium]|nr:GntR family transcriptional regulator [Terriglobia bacterium]